MSGICAVWRRDDPERTGEVLTSVNRGLSLSAFEREARETDLGAGVAISARFPTQQIYGNTRILIACDADLLNTEELKGLAPGQWEQVPANAKTAALLAAMYERFGPEFVEKLRGPFSVAVWDRHERRLMAAIDGFGMNRLVYSYDGKTLLVASRIQAVTASGEVDLQINPHAIPNLLNFSMNLAPETIFTKVHRLPPGCLLLASEGKLDVKPYWDMRYGVGDDADENALSKELESLFEGTVSAHCLGQPFETLGAFLSGGTDSSTVVGMMSRMGQGPVKAFSIGFEEQPFNELGYARIAATTFHAEHHTHLVGAADCFDALPGMIRFFDEPFGNSSAIPTYFCARLAAENGVKTMLAGDGGDELFGGNERYAADRIYGLYHSVPRVLRKGFIEPVLNRMPVEGALVGRARRYVGRANLPGMDRILCHQFLCKHDPTDIFEKDFLTALGGYSILDVSRRYYENAPARDPLDRILYADVKITLGDSDLPKVACMAEMAGIQVRFPFLDRQVAEFSGRVPARLKVKGFQKRYLFKKAFRNLLPVEILKKKKHGFGIPVAGWLKTDPKLRELSRDTLRSRECLERGYFRRDFMESLFQQHEADGSSYYGDTLWTFLVLELWRRQVVEASVGIAV